LDTTEESLAAQQTGDERDMADMTTTPAPAMFFYYTTEQ
jgi:hypothetical protein